MSKNKFIVSIRIDVFVDHEIEAANLEDAIQQARDLNPEKVLRLSRPKKDSVIDWEVIEVNSVFKE